MNQKIIKRTVEQTGKAVGILFSYIEDNRNEKIKCAIEHLRNNKEIYWSVGFSVKREKFVFPLVGLMHCKGDNIRYKCNILEIKPFDPLYYEDSTKTVDRWRIEYNNNPRKWKISLVINEFKEFYYETKEVLKLNGAKVKFPPQGYIKVFIPE